MGACFSLLIHINSENHDKLSASAANLITVTGEFRQFTAPIKVAEVLNQIQSPSTKYFICNSDNLYYYEHIPALSSDNELQSGQIYFVLPNSKLRYPVSASEMAALAVKASVALSGQSSVNRRRISPVLSVKANKEVLESSLLSSHKHMKMKTKTKTKGVSDKQSELGISQSGSIRKLQRYSSGRVKLAARSFKLRLNTIYEGSDILF